jgi:hypothetical protein
LISLWSSLAQQIDGPRPFWNTATGEGNEMACYGQRGCRLAWIYLLEHGEDTAGAKVIAATYCVEHYDECVHEKNFDDMVMDDLTSLLMLGAMGLGSAAEAAAGAESTAGGATAREEAAGSRSSGCPTKNSFDGATLVLMADGSTKPIAQVEVGDEVENAEPGDSSLQRHVVTALHVTDIDRDFVDVSVLTPDGLGIVVTTAHHPFWDATARGWKDAADLAAGDQLGSPGGSRVTVGSVRRYTNSARTYNLTVDSVHTYFVLARTTPVLVHNCNGLPEGYTSSPALEGDPYHPDSVAARSAENQALYGPTRTEQAANLGYETRIPAQKAPFDSHGQTVYFNGKTYISPDVDAHNVTQGWKMFDRRGQRIGTYDNQLNYIKK